LKKKAASGIMLTLLFISVSWAFNIQSVKASGAIYIRPDGSVWGTDKIQRDGDYYTFTGRIYDSIVIERDNIVVDGAGYTLQGTGADAEGILLSGRSNVTVRYVKITEFDTGISLIGSSNNTISGNNIANNGDGIHLYSSSSNNISANEITANLWHGVITSEGVSNVISGNNITNSDDGISVYSGSNNSISGNTIADNLVGIVLSSCYFSCNIFGNTVANNGEGIRFIFSSDNRIYYNNFIGNTKQVRGYRSLKNTWDADDLSGGNYWSDYAGADADGDGIGDTSYIINEGNQDFYPLMSPWGDIPVLPSTRFWPQWWLYAIAAAIILALAVAVYFLKRRKPHVLG